MMVHGKDSVLIKYTIERCPSPGVLRLKPFIAYRGYHALSHQNTCLRTESYAIKNGFEIQPYDGMPAMSIRTNVMSEYYNSPAWYNNFEYQKEHERGFDWREDLFRPGIFEITVTEGSSVIVSASLDMNWENIDKTWLNEAKRRDREASKDTKISETFENEEDHNHTPKPALFGPAILDHITDRIVGQSSQDITGSSIGAGIHSSPCRG